MPPIILSGEVRYAVHGKILGSPWTNIWDFQLNPVGARNDAIQTKARLMLDVYADHIMPSVSSAMTVDSCSWVDLDSATGSTGEVTDTSAHDFPLAGAVVGDTVPANAAVLVIKHTQAGRKFRDGRLYLCGITETQTSGNSLGTGAHSALQAKFNQIYSIVNQPLADGSLSSWGVVSISPGSAAFHNTITSVGVEALLATQRRRLRR